MVSAFCTGTGSEYPLTTYENGAKCGYSAGRAKARILCAPADQVQGSAAPAGEMRDSAAADASTIRLVASGSNTASCEQGETMIGAYCTGGWSEYPLITYPGSMAKCGYSGGGAQATVACLPGAADRAAGLRVVASDTNTAWCEPGESMVSASCSGGGAKNLVTYPHGAKCGYSAGGSKATVVCAASEEESGIRLVSGSNVGACDADETMISAYCTGGWDSYPLLTYPGGRAKCGYSGGKSQVTLACLKK
jgi:hypothetical protein